MDTLKTAVVVVLLLAVLYGVYVVLSKPEAPLSPEIAWHEQKATEPLQIDINSSATPAADATPKSFIRAELSATESSNQHTSDSDKSLSLDKSLSQAVEPPPLKPQLSDAPTTEPHTRSTPDFAANTSPKVPAPTLLPAAAAADADPGASADRAPTDARDARTLPPLREAPSLDNRQDQFVLPTAPVGPAAPTNNSTDTHLDSDLNSISNSISKSSRAGEPELKSSTADNAPISKNDDAAPPPKFSNSGGETTPHASPFPQLQSALQNRATEVLGRAAAVTTKSAYAAAMNEVNAQMEKGEWYQALFVLSKFYNSPDLIADQRKELLDLLDPLAGKVVYSNEHFMEKPYEVQRGDTWATIAEKYQVPPELLVNINGSENPEVLIPGTKLKVVRGPFRAEVDVQAHELTLFVGQLYAGRFPISVGNDPLPKPGEYRVQEKRLGRVYYAGDGRTVAIEDPHNPFGRIWIGLGSDLSIHGSPESGTAGGHGCISLSPRDAQDVYGILSQGSSVLIRR